MRLRWLSFPAASLSLALTACVNKGFSSGGNPTGTGPFDSRGNYVEAWADNPSAWRKGNARPDDAEPDRPAAQVPVMPPTVASNTPPKTTPKPTTSSTQTKPKPTTIASNTPKPKPAVKKPPVKVKPKTTRHTVRSGDNLYNIAKRYGTSVGAIQKANGLKGALIRPGQSLVIPK